MMYRSSHTTEPVAAVVAVQTATRIEQGRRELQEDAVAAHVEADGSWMIAVADGTGGGIRTAEAAGAALAALPPRIGSEDAMTAAFAAANAAVRALTANNSHQPLNKDLGDARSVEPDTTLAVTAWTARGGLLSAWVGDSMVLLIPADGGVGWHSIPHRFGCGHLLIGDFAVTGPDASVSLGASIRRLSDTMGTDDVARIAASGLVAAVISDGVYNSHMGLVRGTWFSDDPADNSIGFLLDPATRRNAEASAEAVMGWARSGGMHDNASAAVAVMSPTTTSGAGAAVRSGM